MCWGSRNTDDILFGVLVCAVSKKLVSVTFGSRKTRRKLLLLLNGSIELNRCDVDGEIQGYEAIRKGRMKLEIVGCSSRRSYIRYEGQKERRQC